MTRRHYDPTTGKVYRTSAGKFGRCIDENPGVPCCDFGGTSQNEAGNQPPPYSSSLWGVIVGGPWDGWPLELASSGPTGAVPVHHWTGSPEAGGIDCGLGSLHKPSFTLVCGSGSEINRFKITSALAGTTVDQPNHSIQSISCFCDTLTVDYGPFVSDSLGDCGSFSWSIKIVCAEICLYTLQGTIPNGFDVDITGLTNTGYSCTQCVTAEGIYDTSNIVSGEEPCSFWGSGPVEFTCHAGDPPSLGNAFTGVLFNAGTVYDNRYQVIGSHGMAVGFSSGTRSYYLLQNSPFDLSSFPITLNSPTGGNDCNAPATLSVDHQ